MKACTKCNVYKSEELMSDGVCNTCESERPEIFQHLQARILELETELRQQKKAAETGARILQLMWRYRFNTESLH